MKLTKLIALFGIFFFLEIILAGNGIWSQFYLGFNLRKINFFFFCLSLSIYFLNKRITPTFLLMVFFPIIGIVCWVFLIPIFFSVPFIDSIHEGSVLIAFAITPLVVLFYTTNNDCWASLKRKIILCLYILAIMHICIALSLMGVMPDSEIVLNGFKSLLNPIEDTSLNLIYTPEELRVGWASSVCMIILIGSIAASNSTIATKIAYLILPLLALYFNGQRGIYFAIVYSSICTLILYCLISIKAFFLRKLFFPISVSISVAAIYFLSNPDLLNFLGFSRPVSDEIRFLQSNVLIQEYIDNFIYGKGLGSSSDLILRSEDAPYSYEQYLLSLMMKVGTIGIAMFFLYSMLWQNEFEKRNFNSFNQLEKKKYYSLFFILLSIFSASCSNPYLFNFVGVVFFYYVAIEFAILFNYRSGF